MAMEDLPFLDDFPIKKPSFTEDFPTTELMTPEGNPSKSPAEYAVCRSIGLC
jgi:hypothetical protein